MPAVWYVVVKMEAKDVHNDLSDPLLLFLSCLSFPLQDLLYLINDL